MVIKGTSSAKVDNRGKTIHFSQTVKFSSVSSTAVACAYPALGLRNGRNFCFANSVLQCLRVTEIHRLIWLHKECLDPSCVVCHLKTFIQESSQTAEPILRQINGIWPEYRLGRQQDALEFLQIIMQEAYKRCSEESREKDHSYSLFYGTEKSTVKCGHCGAESSKEDVYSDICVSIDTVQTVTQAIQSHFSVEEVEYRCSVCNKAGVATKKSTLEEIPKNFVVYLKRFNAGRRKLTKKIDLAFDINLRDYVSPGKMLEDKAQLFGVVVHAGHSVSNGHYYCFIKFGLNWFKIDDMKINSVTELSLTGCQDQPYILFYKTLPRPYTS